MKVTQKMVIVIVFFMLTVSLLLIISSNIGLFTLNQATNTVSLDTSQLESSLKYAKNVRDAKNPSEIIKLSLNTAPSPRPGIDDMNYENLVLELERYYQLNGITYTESEINSEKDQLRNLPLDIQKSVALILLSYNDAYVLNKQALSKLSPDEIKYLNGIEEYDLTKDTRMLSITSKVDVQKQLLGSYYILDAVQKAKPFLTANLIPAAEPTQTSAIGCNMWGDIIFYTHECSFALGGIGDSGYGDRTNKIVIDLGGNDFYHDVGYGASSVGLLVDGGGNDWHACFYTTNACKASGYGNLGIGINIDFAGNDFYDCGITWEPSNLPGNRCQGLGFGGVGILIDYLGDDRYTCGGGTPCQARSDGIGFGYLIDLAGNDGYNCYGGSCQSVSFGGQGILIDLSGDDAYGCYGIGSQCQAWAYGNLAPYSGGEAHLIDIIGNDYYSCGEKCQGVAGNIGSHASLVDLVGDDRYYCTGSTCQTYWYGFLVDVVGKNTFSCARGATCATPTGMSNPVGYELIPKPVRDIIEFYLGPPIKLVNSTIQNLTNNDPSGGINPAGIMNNISNATGNVVVPSVTIYFDDFGWCGGGCSLNRNSPVSSPYNVFYSTYGNQEWNVQQQGIDGNGMAARSGNIGSNQRSVFEMRFRIDVVDAYFYSFRYKIRGKDIDPLTSTGDKLRFSVKAVKYLFHPLTGQPQQIVVDSVICEEFSGVTDWQKYDTRQILDPKNPICTTLTPGEYVFTWEFLRDGGAPVSDTGAWIDHIQIDRRPAI